MSDYTDYDDASEIDDSIYLYDHVEADYVTWGIENPEFNFDDERPMCEFNPHSEYVYLEDEDGNIMMTYQALGKLADMTVKLFVAWEKRAAVDHFERQDPSLLGVEGEDDSPPMFFGSNLNLYQLEMEQRNDLRSYSVRELEMLFGGKEEVMKLRQVVDNISIFVKRIISASLGNSLPCPMPYPVINTILSYLLPVRGAVNIGLVTNDDSKEGERNDMIGLYLAMAEVFDLVKRVMFNIVVNTIVIGPSTLKETLVEKFEDLVERVTSTELQISFEGLDIKVTGSE